MTDKSVDVEAVRRTDYGAFTWRYTERDVALYNLSLGCRWDEGRYVYEGADGFGPLPTFGVIPPYHELLPSLPLHRIIPNFNPVRLPAKLQCCGAVIQCSVLHDLVHAFKQDTGSELLLLLPVQHTAGRCS